MRTAEANEEKRRVLFVCIGNSCRSPMAEGFARRYGSDILEAASAGTSPASIIQPLTYKVMASKNISLDGQQPKQYKTLDLAAYDLVINMSGSPLPRPPACDVREWKLTDPIGQSEEVYTAVRDQIESLVMRLILELRPKHNPQRVERTAHSSSTFRMGRRR